MTALKNAAEIKHMADHGFEIVEGRHIDFPVWCSGTDICNPITHPCREWRIKLDTLKINVEIPRPCRATQAQAALWLGRQESISDPIYFMSPANRDEAERILVAALRG